MKMYNKDLEETLVQGIKNIISARNEFLKEMDDAHEMLTRLLVQEIKNIISDRNEFLKEMDDAHEMLTRLGVHGEDLSLAKRIKMLRDEIYYYL